MGDKALMTDVIFYRDHPSAGEPSPKLTFCSVLMTTIGREIYKVKGGYLACLPNGRSLPGLFPSQRAAYRAQEPYVRLEDRLWILKDPNHPARPSETVPVFSFNKWLSRT
jgi:hypothetical protein